MNFEQIRKAAEEMGVNVQHAVWCRLRYLRQQMQREVAELEFWAESECPTASAFFKRHMETVTKLAREARALSLAAKEPPRERKEDHITDEQIEAARTADVRALIDFDRQGKATAPCHEDKRPSLVFLSRTGKAWCPVCDRKFNAVDWLMETEGLTFPEAVRRLAA
ncbi:CHC2 zinc finger domain-containing protein [Geobacter sp. 60473]|uniref:CHC2 zinc finger domain-containing protein n=1 Tax=Geobacter sp. 60473 TaxID=3080755 RepID=UPI002B2A3B1F|nr:hypothetical protein GEO60473_09540 [Geobacter sp. 60473]